MIDNLRKKVWILDWYYTCQCDGESVDQFLLLDWYYMCQCDGESDQVLLHCSIATDFWFMVVGFGVCWVMPRSVIELLACWQGRFGCRRNGDIWMVVPHYLMWCL